MAIQFYDGKILFTTGGQIAMSENCCCEGIVCTICETSVRFPEYITRVFNYPPFGTLNDTSYQYYDCHAGIGKSLYKIDSTSSTITYHAYTDTNSETSCNEISFVCSTSQNESGWYATISLSYGQPCGYKYGSNCLQDYNTAIGETVIIQHVGPCSTEAAAIESLSDISGTIYTNSNETFTSGTAATIQDNVDLSLLSTFSDGWCHCSDRLSGDYDDYPTTLNVTVSGLNDVYYYVNGNLLSILYLSELNGNYLLAVTTSTLPYIYNVLHDVSTYNYLTSQWGTMPCDVEVKLHQYCQNQNIGRAVNGAISLADFAMDLLYFNHSGLDIDEYVESDFTCNDLNGMTVPGAVEFHTGSGYTYTLSGSESIVITSANA